MFVKGCVRDIFTSLFCMSKRQDLWNKENCFLFHFKGSFHFQKLLSNFKFSDIQMSWRHQLRKHETRSTFYRITWEVNTAW